mgnify:CR=1 FL=1
MATVCGGAKSVVAISSLSFFPCRFIDAWSAYARGEQWKGKVSHDRSGLIQKVELKEVRARARRECDRSPTLQDLPATHGHGGPPGPHAADPGKYTWRHLTFAPKDIERLKQSARSGRAAEQLTDKIVSTNDVLCAHFWQLVFACATEHKDDESFTLSHVLAFRTRGLHTACGIDPDFVGNAFGVVSRCGCECCCLELIAGHL